MSELSVGTLSGLAANSYVIDVASGSQLTQPGMILQVVSLIKSDVFATTSTSLVDITGLSVAITPVSTSSKVMLFCDGLAGNSASVTTVVRLFRDLTAIAPGAGTLGSGANTADLHNGTVTTHSTMPFAFSILDTPGTTSEVTYKVKMASESGGTAYLNRRGANAALGGCTTITLMEVAG